MCIRDRDDGGRVGQLGQRVDTVGYQRQSGSRLVFRDDFAAELAGQAKRLDGRGVELLSLIHISSGLGGVMAAET